MIGRFKGTNDQNKAGARLTEKVSLISKTDSDGAQCFERTAKDENRDLMPAMMKETTPVTFLVGADPLSRTISL